MKSRKLSILWLALCGTLSGQFVGRPSAIETEIGKSGRFALFDRDQDGWDDLWAHLFPKIDVQNLAKDEDNDGKTNYEEMLDFTDPFRTDTKARELTATEIKEAQRSAAHSNRATDLAKRQRFQTAVTNRRLERNSKVKPNASNPGLEQDGTMAKSASSDQPEVFPISMLRQAGSTAPEITSFERLSTGQCMIAWEGEPDRLFDVEFSDDLVNWHPGTTDMPCMAGVGTWSCMTSSTARFFRVMQQEETIIPSDPSGGNGLTTFGGLLSVEADINDNPSFFLVAPRLGGGVQPYAIELYIDGERWDQDFWQSGESQKTSIPVVNLSVGTHTAYAVMDLRTGTTPSDDEPVPVSLGRFRTPDRNFTLNMTYDSYPIAMRATETSIDPDEPDGPQSTVITADFGGEVLYHLSLSGSQGAREWTGSADSLAIPWDGTDEQGNPVPGGRYGFSLTVNGGGSDLDVGSVVAVAAGQRSWKMLCMMEPMAKAANTPWNFNLFRPEWTGQLASSGNSTDASAAWGPWAPLGSLANVITELKQPQGSLGKTGKWKIKQWASSGGSMKFNDKIIPDPVASFASGGNPFNTYEMGLFLGHGVASTGGSYNTAQGVKVLAPQHYMPIITDPATGAATWVKSASQIKYGAAGSALNWMFLMTCNSLRDHAPHGVYSIMKNAGTLPIGPDLHVLCGYETSIDIAAGMGKLLSDGLQIEENGPDSNTVVLAWGNVWRKSLNNGTKDAKGNEKQSRTARAVFWPECENDTIYGVPDENVTDPTGPYVQSRLRERDFKQ
jgi:hypothetical protein